MSEQNGKRLLLIDLTSSELSSELSKAGLAISGENVGDREQVLRLSTYLIDKGENPFTFEFKTTPGRVLDSRDQKTQNERTKLLERVIKFEKRVFSRRDGA